MGRRFFVSLLCIASVSVQGCTVITREFRHPGGYPGKLLDDRTFDASYSKQLALLRATIIMSMAARVSNGTIQNSDEASAVAEYLAATADEINAAAATLYPVGGVNPCSVLAKVPTPVALAKPLPLPQTTEIDRLKEFVEQADKARSAAQAAANAAEQSAKEAQGRLDEVNKAIANGGLTASAAVGAPTAAAAAGPCNGAYTVNFESELPLIEGRMIRLLYATLPQDRIKNFASSVAKGDVLGGAWNAFKLIGVSLKGLHYGTGSYRSGQEIVALNIIFSSPERESNAFKNCKDLNEARSTVRDAVTCLGLDPENLFGPHPNELKEKALAIDIAPQSFEALFLIARTSCVRLPLGTSENTGAELREIRERRREACEKLRFRPKPREDIVSRE